MNSKWEKTSSGNYVLDGDGFFVSFRPSSRASSFNHPLADIAGSMFDGDNDGGSETALVKETGARPIYCVLNGDHRDAFAAVVDKGFDACFAVYAALEKEHGSCWSEADSIPAQKSR